MSQICGWKARRPWSPEAGSGIGRATALLFAREGARVVVSDLREADALETADAVRSAGGQAATAAGDVSRSADAAGMVRTAVQSFGRLDVLVNSAGISSRNALAEGADPEEVWGPGVGRQPEGELPGVLVRGPGDGALGRGIHYQPGFDHRAWWATRLE